MINKHPTYPFPTIEEVVCEIHFQLDKAWDKSLYSQYSKRIGEKFSDFQPVSMVAQMKAQLGSGATSLVIPQVIRYIHISRNIFIQLAENRLSVHVLPRYSGWKQFSTDIAYAWDAFQGVANPIEITRIGLRYINRIERSSPVEKLSRWLNPTDYVPKAILESDKGFSSQTLVKPDEQNRIKVTIIDQPTTNESSGSFIFDIDRILDQSIGVETSILLNHATILHGEIWDVFDAAKSDDLENLLCGELI